MKRTRSILSWLVLALVNRHVLKVFLLDRENGARNVYSAGFFDDELVLNDLRTVARANGES